MAFGIDGPRELAEPRDDEPDRVALARASRRARTVNDGVARTSYGGPNPHTDHSHIEQKLPGSKLRDVVLAAGRLTRDDIRSDVRPRRD